MQWPLPPNPACLLPPQSGCYGRATSALRCRSTTPARTRCPWPRRRPARPPKQPAIDPTDPMQRLEQTFPHLSPDMAARVARYGTRGERRRRHDPLRPRRAERGFLPGHRRLHRDLRPGPGRPAARLHRASRAAILRRARPLQQPRHPGERPRRRGFAHRAGQAPGFPPPRRQRAGYRRDHHARLHPAPRRPDPPRAWRRAADRPRPCGGYAHAAALSRRATASRTASSTARPIRTPPACSAASSSTKPICRRSSRPASRCCATHRPPCSPTGSA